MQYIFGCYIWQQVNWPLLLSFNYLDLASPLNPTIVLLGVTDLFSSVDTLNPTFLLLVFVI